MKKKIPVNQIYKRFNIPENLARHMLWVAQIGVETIENWVGPNIDQENIISVLLLHDIGNIIKFELHSNEAKKNYSQRELEKLLPIQKKMIALYGNNADIANISILEEIGVNKDVIQLLTNHSFDYLPTLLDSENWNEKIVFYADLRVAPWGIVPLKKRVENLRDRYSHRNQQWKNKTTYSNWLNWSNKLEKQLNQQTSIDLKHLTLNSDEKKTSELSAFKISIEV